MIVVCWNAQDVLGRCLEHLAAQEHGNYEVIVVDDGSTDETVTVAERASSRRPVKVVRSERNRGCPAARNLGLRHARGEIVAFIDADGYAAPTWLSRLTRAFAGDASIGGVASTVFFDDDPLVLNGAGGTVNRQGWAADLAMNESYEWAELAEEALYPMGCGMAFRREVLDAVGPFDDRMLNYYDDVDYGTRVWRAGRRVVVAGDAWIDHGFGAGAESVRKRLLCERHRMRVVLKHAPRATLLEWGARELRSLRAAPRRARTQKLAAIAWNIRWLPDTVAQRWRLRGVTRAPDTLIADSWGDGFPAGVPQRPRPVPERARASVELGAPEAEAQLLDGWYPIERSDGRSYRWAAVHAAMLVSLERRARLLRLDFAHPPQDTGCVELTIRPVGADDASRVAWRSSLRWQYAARSLENHPIELPAGDYEVRFDAARGWLEPPSLTRLLGLALSAISFEEDLELAAGGLDLSAPAAERQLVSGWFEAEPSPHGVYRWSAAHAAAIVRAERDVRGVRLGYRMPPGESGPVTVAFTPLGSGAGVPVATAQVEWQPGEWRERMLDVPLARGDYVVDFDCAATWSNVEGRDARLPPENRALGIALASLTFVSS